MIHPTIEKVYESIVKRSQSSRGNYLREMKQYFNSGINRVSMSCGNLAHSFAACSMQDKLKLKDVLGLISELKEVLIASYFGKPFVEGETVEGTSIIKKKKDQDVSATHIKKEAAKA